MTMAESDASGVRPLTCPEGAVGHPITSRLLSREGRLVVEKAMAGVRPLTCPEWALWG